MNILHRDYETRSAVDLKKCGLDVYARHPSTEVICMAYAWNDTKIFVKTPEQFHATDMNEQFFNGMPSEIYVAHNDAFESAIEEHVFPRQFGFKPDWPLSQHRCTMAMAYAMAIPGSLGEAAMAVGLKAQKDTVGSRVMLKLCRPKTENPLTFWTPEEVPEQFEALYAYCKQDVEVERELYKRLAKLSPHEQKVWELDRQINNAGVSIDVEAAKIAIQLIELEKKRLDKAMNDLTDGGVMACTTAAQLVRWLNAQGVETDSVKKEIVLDLLDKDIPDIARQALLLRQEAAKSSTAKLIKMIDGLCPDGRVRGLFQYHGAATGRWAGRRVQLQNLPRPKVKQDVIDSIFEILLRD
jgi:DNA polymerase